MCYWNSYASPASDIIKKARPATALSKVILYADSTFTSDIVEVYYSGELFEVVRESFVEHEDSDQKQKFKWYSVKAEDGTKGWLFGDGIAVVIPDYKLDYKLRDFNKKEINFSKGFEESIMWIGEIKGRDNFHLDDALNPLYNETYLIITNKNGYSLNINISSENEDAKHTLRAIKLYDLTGDGTEEIILENESIMTDGNNSNINISVYSMQSGMLKTIFEERTSLKNQKGSTTPAIAKYVDIEGDILRIEYMDYVDCSKYSLRLPTDKRSTHEYCMELVTYSYKWNNRKKIFDDLFEETRMTPKAQSKYGSLSVRKRPTFASKKVGTLDFQETFKVIKHYDKIILKNGEKKTETYLFIQLLDGTTGYILANHATFINSFHAPMISKYYNCKNKNTGQQLCTSKPASFLGVH